MGCELLKLVQLISDGVNDEVGATYQYGGLKRQSPRRTCPAPETNRKQLLRS